MGSLFTDWVLGTIFRPGATFVKARRHLQAEVLWIFLCVLTLETVIAIFQSPDRGDLIPLWSVVALRLANFLAMILFMQTISFFGAARIFGWAVPLAESLKYVGLSWSILLLEDVVTFIPVILGHEALGIRLSLAFVAWSVGAMATGLRRVTRMASWQAILLAAMALAPMRLIFFYLYFVR
ncbi:MAG TPA: YIP1 family protein [Symbiobacteriaceae bacterium]|nr:YIP1 family protein [Symbiobacteriaceae bacterium]